MNRRNRVLTGFLVVKIAVTVAAAWVLFACANPTAAEDLCHWKYTAFKVYATLGPDGKLVQTSQYVPVDSVRVCTSKALTQG